MTTFNKKIKTLKKESWKKEATIDFLIEDFEKWAGARDFKDFVKAVESAETEQFKSLVELFENVEVALETNSKHGETIDAFVWNNFFSDSDIFEKKLHCDGLNLWIDVSFFKFDEEAGWEWLRDNFVAKIEDDRIFVAVEIGEMEDFEKDLLVWTAEVLN